MTLILTITYLLLFLLFIFLFFGVMFIFLYYMSTFSIQIFSLRLKFSFKYDFGHLTKFNDGTVLRSVKLFCDKTLHLIWLRSYSTACICLVIYCCCHEYVGSFFVLFSIIYLCFKGLSWCKQFFVGLYDVYAFVCVLFCFILIGLHVILLFWFLLLSIYVLLF